MSASIGVEMDLEDFLPDADLDGTYRAAEFAWQAGATYSEGGSQAVDNALVSLFTGLPLPTEFNTYSHASLGAIVGTDGSQVVLSDFGVEITMVSGFTERVVPLTFEDVLNPAGVTVHFEFVDGQPNEFLEIYFDDTPDANPISGRGYNDGQLIFSADITAMSESYFTVPNNLTGEPDVTLLDSFFLDGIQNNVLTVVGHGATTFEANVTHTADDLFISDISSVVFQIDHPTPFTEVSPSEAFVTAAGGEAVAPAQEFGVGLGIPGVGIGFINGAGQIPAEPGAPIFGGPDITFQSTSTTTFRLGPLSKGFWQANLSLWAEAGVDPNASFNETFGLTGENAPADQTLLEALTSKGGGEAALAQEAVIVLLNIGHSEVDYAVSADDLTLVVQSTYETGNFKEASKALKKANNGDFTDLLALIAELPAVV